MTTSLLLAVVVVGLVGCPRLDNQTLAVDVTVYNVTGQVGETILDMPKYARTTVSEPGGLVFDLTASSWPMKIKSAVGVAQLREEYGGGTATYDLVTGDIVSSSGVEKQEEALIGLALVWLGSAANTAFVVSGIAHTIPLLLPIIVLAEDGQSAQFEMPFSPVVQEVTVSLVVEIRNQEYSWSAYFSAPISPTSDLSVEIKTPLDGAELIEGGEQLFTAEATGVEGVVTLVWVFPDNTASVGPIVGKTVASTMSGEILVFATTTIGQLAVDSINVTTTGGGGGDLAVEIISPVAGSTVEGTISFEAEVSNAVGDVEVLWQLPDGTTSNQLAFQLDIADLDLPAGSWTWWASVRVTDGDGNVATENVAFVVKVPSVGPEELIAEITSPVDGITINVGNTIIFTGDVSGGVDPLGQPYWFFPDSTKLFGKEVNKKFTFPGEGYVYFGVKDAEGNTAFDQIWVKVVE